MILYVSQEYYGEAVPIPFPATMEQVRDELGGLGTGSQPLFIRGSGPVWHFEDRLDQADLVQESGVQKLNRLANLVDAMDLAAQKVFAGALRAESINGLDDILEVASSLSRYEFIEGVTTDKELGGWLVEYGMRSAGNRSKRRKRTRRRNSPSRWSHPPPATGSACPPLTSRWRPQKGRYGWTVWKTP